MATGDFKKKIYNSSSWQKIRKQVLSRDFYICQICGECNCNIVHHVIEITEANQYDTAITNNVDNCITVCNQCHDEIHSRNYRREKLDYHFDANGNFIPSPPDTDTGCKQYRKDYTEEQKEKIKYYQSRLNAKRNDNNR